MPGWGLGLWGLDPWGGGTAVAEAGGNNPPVITSRLPAPRSINNPVNSLLVVRFFDADFDLNTSTTLIEINGAVVFNGGVTSVGYVSKVSYSAGSYIIQLYKLGGWTYGQTVTIRGFIQDQLGNTADDTWSWTVEDNPICYTGLSPLTIEKRLRNPFNIYLNLEPVRQRLLDKALKIQPQAIPNPLSKAARVVYQLGYSTELSTILNQYVERDEDALRSIVCEKEKAIVIDESLTPFKPQLQTGVENLYSTGIINKEYINTLHDYQDSLTYSYRVSLAANLVLLVAAVELESESG